MPSGGPQSQPVAGKPLLHGRHFPRQTAPDLPGSHHCPSRLRCFFHDTADSEINTQGTREGNGIAATASCVASFLQGAQRATNGHNVIAIDIVSSTTPANTDVFSHIGLCPDNACLDRNLAYRYVPGSYQATNLFQLVRCFTHTDGVGTGI